jgi:hypothetical protein
MKTFKQYLLEHYLTTDKLSEKEPYHDAIHAMIKSSYKNIGGYGGLGHDTDEEYKEISKDIRDPNHIIKLNKSKGVPVAVRIYKKSHGRKSIAAATDGSDEGKRQLTKTAEEDVKFKRAWGEVSHGMARLSDKVNAPKISNTKVKELTGKESTSNPDNTYDRIIGGTMHTKELRGHTGSNWASK